jgi:hypothetical protein
VLSACRACPTVQTAFPSLLYKTVETVWKRKPSHTHPVETGCE